MSDENEYDEHGYHQDQLKPGSHPPYNHVLHAPPGEEERIGSLWIELTADADRKVVTAASFDLEDRHRAMVAAGAHVRLQMWQHPICPISMSVEAPFCECHQEEMAFSEHDGGFFCPHQKEVGDDLTPQDEAHRDFTPAPDDDPDDEPGS